MADFTLSSLRGGMNSQDPPVALPDDQSVMAMNVEYTKSTLGERRRGAQPITIDSLLANREQATFLHRHLPTSNEAQSELWVMATTGESGYFLARKDIAWRQVPIDDAIILTEGHQYQVQGVSLHGKLFLAHKSAVDRLHVWDGASVRRSGLQQPVAPTVADATGGGTYTTTRYFRVRYVKVGGLPVEVALDGTREVTPPSSRTFTLRATAANGEVAEQAVSVDITDGYSASFPEVRSESSEAITFTPSGSNAGAVITKPAAVDESETHWEVEASDALNGTYYTIKRLRSDMTTYTDTASNPADYRDLGVISEDIGDYTPIPSARFLAADEDRLLIGGSFENRDFDSRVAWTPVFQDPGVGNDERIPIDVDSYLDLDGFNGGRLTALHGPVNGYAWAFKQSHIYKLVRTGNRAQAYEAVAVSKTRGAIEGSVVEGVDQGGYPTLYFLDPAVGPCRLGQNGIRTCGTDILATWRTRINLNATVVCRSVYYPSARQVHWWVATGASDFPNLRIVLHVNEMREDEVGEVRRGITLWDGPSAGAITATLYADNIDSNDPRSLSLKPYIGVIDSTLVWETDTGETDNTEAYTAQIITKSYSFVTSKRDDLPTGILRQATIKGVAVIGLATNAEIDVSIRGNFKATRDKTERATFTPSDDQETNTIVFLDDVDGGELNLVQFVFEDTDTPMERWELSQLVASYTLGQRKYA